MDSSGLARASQLYDEIATIDAALGNFEAGGVIVSMTVSGGPLNPPPQTGEVWVQPRDTVTVQTESITYPAQMVDGIRTQLQARRTAITQELTDMGITLVA